MTLHEFVQPGEQCPGLPDLLTPRIPRACGAQDNEIFRLTPREGLLTVERGASLQ